MAAMGLALTWLWSWANGDNSTALIWQTVIIGVLISLLDVGEPFQNVIIPATRTLLLILMLRWAIRLWLRSGGMKRVV